MSDSDSGSSSEEEDAKDYRRGGYHPVRVGEELGRFRVLSKLGWGHFSTVWKVVDSRSGHIAALKVQKSAEHYTEAAWDEIELLRTTVKCDERRRTIEAKFAEV